MDIEHIFIPFSVVCKKYCFFREAVGKVVVSKIGPVHVENNSHRWYVPTKTSHWVAITNTLHKHIQWHLAPHITASYWMGMANTLSIHTPNGSDTTVCMYHLTAKSGRMSNYNKQHSAGLVLVCSTADKANYWMSMALKSLSIHAQCTQRYV